MDDLCFICNKKHDVKDMYPLLFATNEDKTSWELSYCCKECDAIFGFLQKDNLIEEWNSWTEAQSSFCNLFERIEKNLLLIDGVPNNIKYYLQKIKEELESDVCS